MNEICKTCKFEGCKASSYSNNIVECRDFIRKLGIKGIIPNFDKLISDAKKPKKLPVIKPPNCDLNFPLKLYKDKDGEISTKYNPEVDQDEFLLGIIYPEPHPKIESSNDSVFNIMYHTFQGDRKYLSKSEILKVIS